MAEKPLVSILVPVHGTERHLSGCLDSLFAQTTRDFEIVAVDDASPDNSLMILRQYAAMDSRLRIIRNTQNQGLYATRLIAFATARGKYLTVCDSDDVLPPRALEYLVAAAERTGADIIHGRTRLLIQDRPAGLLRVADPFAARTGLDYAGCMLRYTRSWNVWGKVYRREVWEKATTNLPVGKKWFLAEDLAFSMSFALRARGYAELRRPVYHYRPPVSNKLTDPATAMAHIASQVEILAYVQSLCAEHRILEKDCGRFLAHMVGSMWRNIPDTAVHRTFLAEKLEAELGQPSQTSRAGRWQQGASFILSRLLRTTRRELGIDILRLAGAVMRKGAARALSDVKYFAE